MTKEEKEEYDALWDEKIALKDQVLELADDNIHLRNRLAEVQIELMDAADAMTLMSTLWVMLPLRGDTKEERQYRKVYTQAFVRAQKSVTRALETEDPTEND